MTQVDRLRLLGFSGSNKLLAGELSRLARRAFPREIVQEILPGEPRKIGIGGIGLPFDARLAALAVTYHRTSARCLWDLYETRVTRLEPLYEEVLRDASSDTRPWCWDGAKISVLAFHTDSIEAGERQVVGTVKNALVDAARARGVRLEVDAEHPDLVVHARSRFDEGDERGTLSVSLDLAGRPLHQRGYRTESGAAPLREDLAAALVMLARHDPKTEFLLDPLAGAGTILVEASHAAQGRALWTSGREPIAARHPVLGEAFEGLGEPLFADTKPPLFACEIDAPTEATLRRSLETAGVLQHASIHAGDFRDADPTRFAAEASARGYEHGLLLTNPPYGARLEMPEEELYQLYRDLGDFARQTSVRRAGFLVGEPNEHRGTPRAHLFQDAFGGRARITKPLRNGPLRALFLLYDF